MILSYKDLKRAWRNGTIRFEPDIDEKQLGLSSIDLRLGYQFTWLKPKDGLVIRPAAEGFDPSGLIDNVNLDAPGKAGRAQSFRLKPREFALGQTLENVAIPRNLAAQVQGRSSLARAGLSVHATAPHINPGWAGRITLEMYNSGPWELDFDPGKDLICQVIYFKVTHRVSKKAANSMATFMGQQAPWPRRRT